MTSRLPRLVSKLAVALYPSSFRRERAAEIEAGCLECFRRERERLGACGIPYAAIVLVIDSLVAGFELRALERRRRRLCSPRGETPMNSLWQDVRYAARSMRRTPAFSLVVVLTLALAIGATTAIFGVVDAVLLRSLPYRDPGRLVMLYQTLSAISGPIGFSAPDYTGFLERARGFDAIAAFKNKEYELSGIAEPERVTGIRAAASLFDTLGVQPAIGRSFSAEEDKGRQPVVVLSDGLWRRKFGADPSIVGRAVSLDRRPYTVVGVMPRGFVFPNRGPVMNNLPADIYVPISYTPTELGGFGMMFNNSVVARLKPGVSIAAANAEANTVAAQIVRDLYPAEYKQWDLKASATPIRDETVGRIQTTLVVLLAAVGVVLLIACADIANLLMTRAAAREREMAVRAALGAGRGRLIRQVLVESGVLALTGGALGIAFAWWASRALVRLAPPTIPRTGEVGLDVRMLVFALGVSMLTALLSGLLPAWETSRRDSGDRLKEGSRAGTSSVRQRRIFSGLVALQFALAAVLLVAGGLLVRSFAKLIAVDPGFRAEQALTLGTSLPARAYRSGSDIRAFYTRLLERVDALPGVTATGFSTDLPLSVRDRRAFTIESQPQASAEIPHVVAPDWTLGRYFEALGIALRQGRYLQPGDQPDSEPVVVINETMAKKFWPGLDPVGQRMAWGGPDNHLPWMRIVGVVADVKQGPLNTETFQQTYTPWLQLADGMIAEIVIGVYRSLKVTVRTAIEPASLATAIRGQIREIDPSLPVTQVQTMVEVVQASTGPQRFNTVLLGSFASVALLLAALGIGGVLATSVSRRTQEMGVRLALGAEPLDLVRMVVRQGMLLAATGITVGVIAAFGLTRLMSTLLFRITPYDPVTFVTVGGLLLSVAMLACYIPARRATRVDPMVALRYE